MRKRGLICRRTLLMVCRSCSRPLAGRYCACNRDESAICCGQSVDRQHTKAGGTVQQDKVIVAFGAFQNLFQDLLPAHGIYKAHFQLDAGRNKIHPFGVVQYPLPWLDGLVRQDFTHQGGKGRIQFIRPGPTHADGQAGLWVGVYKQDLFALHGKADPQIFAGRGLTCSSLLINHGNHGCFLGHTIVPPSAPAGAGYFAFKSCCTRAA